MLNRTAIVVPPGAVAQVRGFLRVDGTTEDALLAELLRTGCEACEGFTGQAVIAREWAQDLVPTGGWQRLEATPVRDVIGVARPEDGVPFPLEAYGVDIDANGDGWVRVDPAVALAGAGTGAGARARVRFRAGMAEGWDAVPDAMRHGIVRLAAHLFARRDDAGEPPPTVAALWRPYRRMPFGRQRDARPFVTRGVVR